MALIDGSALWCVQAHIVLVLMSTLVMSKYTTLVFKAHVDVGNPLFVSSFRLEFFLLPHCLCLLGVADLGVGWLPTLHLLLLGRFVCRCDLLGFLGAFGVTGSLSMSVNVVCATAGAVSIAGAIRAFRFKFCRTT